MSNKGIYSALSGVSAQSRRLETIANNIANANTTGFKKDRNVFNEYLTSYEKQDTDINVPRVPASLESFYAMNGGDLSYVDEAGTFTSHESGGLKETGNPFDIHLEGEGFFEVLTPAGVRLTRNGSFTKNLEGVLVTKDGHPVLMAGLDRDPAERILNLGNSDFTVSPTGEIFTNQENRGSISVVVPNDYTNLTKQGSSLFAVRDLQPGVLAENLQPKLRQGALETSNVNVIQEMTNMIEASRMMEVGQNAIKAFNEIDGKLINEVPKV